MQRMSWGTIGVLIGLVISTSPASGITVGAPTVNVSGRRIEVYPWFESLVREALANPENTTDEVRWDFALDIEEVSTGTHLFGAAPTGLPVAPVWVWLGAPDPWSASILGDGNSCWLQFWATQSCYCQTGFGACPGNCDELLTLHPDYCYIGMPQPLLVTEASPIKPNTTYRVRVLHFHLDPAVAGVDYLESPTTEITTGWQPPSLENLPVTNGTPNSAQLNGRVVPRYTDTDYWWEYGLTNSYGNVTATQTIPASQGDVYLDVNAVIGGLMGGQSYHYRLVCQNFGGTTYGTDQIITSEYTMPGVTTGSATILGNSVQFSGVVDPNNMTTNYYVQVGTTTSYGSTVSGGAMSAFDPPATVTLVGTGFTAGQLYHWRLAAVSGGGVSYGADSTFVMPVSFAPVVETGSATDITQNSATINGRINPNGSAGSWYVEYGPTSAFGYTHFGGGLSATTSMADVLAMIAGLNPDTDYVYRIVASNANGTTPGSSQTFRTGSGVGQYLDLANFKCKWIDQFNTAFLGGAAKRGVARKSSATLTFAGDGIRLWSMRDPTLGRMRVTVDGKRGQTVDLNGPTAYQVNVYEVTGLGSGKHTLKVEAAPTKKKVHILVDAVEIID